MDHLGEAKQGNIEGEHFPVPLFVEKNVLNIVPVFQKQGQI